MNKFLLSIKLNIVAIIAATFNFIEFLKLAILRIFYLTEKFLILFGAIIGLFFAASFFWISKDIGFSIFTLVIFAVIIGVFLRITPTIITILEAIFNILNFIPAIDYFNRKLTEKFNEYMTVSEGLTDSDKLFLLPTYLIFGVIKTIRNGFPSLRVLAYPSAMVLFGWYAYDIAFIQHAPPSPGDNDFIPCVLLVMIATLAGAAFAKSVIDTVKSSMEDADFGFLDILFWYFGNENYSSGQHEEQDHSANTTSENDYNPYYDFFRTASTYEDLKRMYREKITEYHPDNAKETDIEYCTKETAKIIEAFKYYKKQKFQR